VPRFLGVGPGAHGRDDPAVAAAAPVPITPARTRGLPGPTITGSFAVH